MAKEPDTKTDDLPETTDFNELWEDDDIPDDITDDEEGGDDDEDDPEDDGGDPDGDGADVSDPSDDDDDEGGDGGPLDGEDDDDADDDEEGSEDDGEEGLEADLKKAAAKVKKGKEAKPEEVEKIVIDGMTHEVTKEQLVREYGTSISSSQRYQESKQMREEAETFFREYTGPKGFDAMVEYHTPKLGSRTLAREFVRDMALEWLAPDLEGATITDPREKAIYDERRAINDERVELERTKTTEAAARARRADDKFVDELRVGIKAGLKKHDLPKHKEIWIAIGTHIDTALKGGAKRAEVLQAVESFVERVAAERKTQAKALIPTLSKKELEKMFPDQTKELREGGRKDRVETVRTRRKKKQAGAASRGQRKKSKEPKWVELHDAFE